MMQQTYYYLLLSGVMSTLLWLPYVAVKLIRSTAPCPDHYSTCLPNWAERLKEAHLNMLKTISPFAAVVIATGFLTSNGAGRSGDEITFWAGIFFWANTAHAMLHVLGSEFIKIPMNIMAWFSIFAIAAQAIL